jgi:glutaredoxin
LRQEIIFYKRKECHLCDNALEILRRLQNEHDFTLKLVDIEENDDLEEKYGLYIPVVEIDGEVIQFGQIDEHVIRMRLQKNKNVKDS